MLIQGLVQQLKFALKQVQDLAVKAIKGTIDIDTARTVKEIAVEQAKIQIKDK